MTPDADGYCVLTLTEGKTTLSVGEPPEEIVTGMTPEPGQDTTAGNKPGKGCGSAFGVSLLLPLCMAAVLPLVRRRKED